MSRAAFSSLEVVFASLVLVLLLVPLMSLSSSYNREAGFLEFHLLAQARARALVDVLATQDLVTLESALAARFTPGAGNVSEALIALPDALRERLGQLDFEARPVAPGARRRSTLFTDALWLGRQDLTAAGTAAVFRLRAAVAFSFPTDPRPGTHTVGAVRLVARPGLSHQVLPEL